LLEALEGEAVTFQDLYQVPLLFANLEGLDLLKEKMGVCD